MPLLPEFCPAPARRGPRPDGRRVLRRLDVRAMLPGLRQVADEWRPDLIVRESWEYGSTIVAEERGIPLARVGLGTAGVEDVSERAAAPAIDAARAEAGLSADPHGDVLRAAPYFTDLPEILEDPADRRRRARCASAPATCRRPRCPTTTRSSTSASARSPRARTCRSTRALPRGDRGTARAAGADPAHRREDRDHAELARPAQRDGRALGPAGRGARPRRGRRHARRPRLDARRARPWRAVRGAAAVRARPVVQRRRGGRARAPASPSTASATRAARSTSERGDVRRTRPAVEQCSTIRARGSGGACAQAMRALPPVDDAPAALARSPPAEGPRSLTAPSPRWRPFAA